MGKNNRQHRAAKHRARQDRQSSAASGRPPSRGSGESPFVRPVFDQGPTAAERRRADAEVLLARLLAAARSCSGSTWLLTVEQQLATRPPELLDALDQGLTNDLTRRIALLWENGWQPLDVVHVVRRSASRLVWAAAALIAVDAQRTGAETRAPQDWLAQLGTVVDSGSSSGPLTSGRLVAHLQPDAGSWVDLWADLLSLCRVLRDLPPLEALVPPPSRWEVRAVSRPRGSDTSERGKLLNRIRALLAKAEATEYAAEAETFTAKAQDLMTRYAVDEALLHAEDEQIEVTARRVHLPSPYAEAKVTLLDVIGRANRVRTIYLDRFAIATTVGTPVQLEQVEMLFTSLLIQATRAMTEAGTRRAGSFDRSAMFRKSFLTAYAYRIGERLKDSDEAAVATYGNALVPVLARQTAAVDSEFDRLFPNTRKLGGGSLDGRGWAAGRAAADQATFVAGRLTG